MCSGTGMLSQAK